MRNKTLFFLSLFVALFVFATATSAQEGETVLVKFDQTQIQVKNKNTFDVNVYLDTSPGSRLSGAAVVMQYPKMLQFVEAGANEKCKQDGYKLTQLLGVKEDKDKGVVGMTRVLIDRDENLPTGHFCFGTVTFKASSNSFWWWWPWYSQSGFVNFTSTDKWEAVGPNKMFKALPTEDAKSVKVKIVK